jgi:hypothetical protein
MENNKKTTAVDWLEHEFSKLYYDTNFKTFEEFNNKGLELWEQAKEMEKEQIIEFANRYGFDICHYDYDRAEQYYNKTYENNSNKS